MEKENQPIKLPYNFHDLQYADVAKDYLTKEKGDGKGIKLAQKALEMMLIETKHSHRNLNDSITDPAVLQKSIESTLGEYSEQKGNQTIKELMGYHKLGIEKYVGEENTPELEKELEPFMDEKYGVILDKYLRAKHIVEGKEKHDLGSDEDIKKAQDTLKKYEKVILTIQVLDSRKLSSLQNRVENEVAKDTFKSLYSPKAKEAKEIKLKSYEADEDYDMAA